MCSLRDDHGRFVRSPLDQRGVTYLMLMVVIVFMGIMLTVAGKQWTIMAKRDLERELLFRGNRIKAAIEAYAADYQVMKAVRPNRYPLSLEQLTQKPKRYLPLVYKDPITGQDFELIKTGDEIRGVKSRSLATPLDRVRFKDAATYNQMAFRADATASRPCMARAGPVHSLIPSACPPSGQAPHLPGAISSISRSPNQVFGINP